MKKGGPWLATFLVLCPLYWLFPGPHKEDNVLKLLIKMVEAAGVEPASENTPLKSLHA
jgi:hypothetical protein